MQKKITLLLVLCAVMISSLLAQPNDSLPAATGEPAKTAEAPENFVVFRKDTLFPIGYALAFLLGNCCLQSSL